MPSPKETLTKDADVAPLVEAHWPVELEPAEDLFARTIVSILRQQISMDAAAAVRERMFAEIEVTPEGVLAADRQTLRDAGLSEAKTDYVRNVAHAFQEHGYDHAYFADMDDEDVMEELTAIAGVGPWSAKMVLLFGLAREDVFPVEDLGIRQAMHQVVDPDLTRGEMVDRAEAWAPYRSYATLLLWSAIE